MIFLVDLTRFTKKVIYMFKQYLTQRYQPSVVLLIIFMSLSFSNKLLAQYLLLSRPLNFSIRTQLQNDRPAPPRGTRHANLKLRGSIRRSSRRRSSQNDTENSLAE